MRSFKIPCDILVCLFLLAGLAAASPEPRKDLKTEVQKALALSFPRDADESRKRLSTLGPPAIPFIAEAIRSSSKGTPIRKAFLVDVIAGIAGEESGSALISLLSCDDPYVRGLSAHHLGKQRFRAALPKLVKLLKDKEVYQTVVYTDPPSEVPVLVRDVAIEALQSVTGRILMPKGTADQQARAWMRWWRKQQRLKGRSSTRVTH